MNPFLVLLLGMGTVFLGLFCLVVLIKVMSWALKKKSTVTPEKKAEPELASASDALVPEGYAPHIADRSKFDAAVAAAIAEYIGGDISGIRITSVKQVGEVAADRGSFVAAVSAAIATTMDTDVKGLKILSIKQN